MRVEAGIEALKKMQARICELESGNAMVLSRLAAGDTDAEQREAVDERPSETKPVCGR